MRFAGASFFCTHQQGIAPCTSEVYDPHLREVVWKEQTLRWLQEYADFVAAYNATLAAEDFPLAEFREL